MKDRLKTMVVAAAPALLVLTAGAAPAAAQDDTIRVGITLRMLVENGIKYGHMSKDQLEAVNASGGINGHKIEVILLDDECKPDKGVANVNRFIHQHKVHLIIGSTCSSVSLPIADVTSAEKVPQIVPHSTNASITQKGNEWVFRVSVSERFYAAVHAKYLSENVGKKVAYLYTTDGAAISFAEQYMDYMRDTYQVEPLYAEQMQETDLDFRSHLLKIKSLAAGGARDRRPGGRDRPDCAAILRGRHPNGRRAGRRIGRVQCARARARGRRRRGPDLCRRLLVQGRAADRSGIRRDGAGEVRRPLPGSRLRAGLRHGADRQGGARQGGPEADRRLARGGP